MTDIDKVEAFLGIPLMTIEDIMIGMMKRGYYTSIALHKLPESKAYWSAWVMDNIDEPVRIQNSNGPTAKKALCKAIVMCDGIIPKGETK